MTAEEFISQYFKTNNIKRTEDNVAFYIDVIMIEFAKFHVEAALLTAVEKIEPTEENLELAQSIINAYSLTNIK